jgi:hypothetical protein
MPSKNMMSRFCELMIMRTENMIISSGIFALAFILIVSAAESGSQEANKLKHQLDEDKLLSGGIQVFEDEYDVRGQGKKKRVVGVQIINAPAEKVWKAISDWEGQAEYVPGLEYNKPIHTFQPRGFKDKTGNLLFEEQIRVLYLTITYTLNARFDKANYRIEWNLVTDEQAEAYNREDIPVKKSTRGLKNIEGFEYVEPYGDGSRTIHCYAPVVEVSIPLPEFVDRILSRNTLKGYMEGIRKMVDSLDNDRSE